MWWDDPLQPAPCFQSTSPELLSVATIPAPRKAWDTALLVRMSQHKRLEFLEDSPSSRLPEAHGCHLLSPKCHKSQGVGALMTLRDTALSTASWLVRRCSGLGPSLVLQLVMRHAFVGTKRKHWKRAPGSCVAPQMWTWVSWQASWRGWLQSPPGKHLGCRGHALKFGLGMRGA